MDYPVLDILGELKEKLSTNPIVILQAPPGAGKSTVIPIKLVDDQWLGGKKIIMLEPRRLAARSVALRASELLGEEAGATVGYRVRFESRVSSKTRIEVVTEGILTRMMQSNNSLDGIGLLIFDEFHERSLNADLALALALQSQQILRPDLRILIMSATLDGENLSALLKCPIVTSEGRQFPVSLIYTGTDPKAPVASNVARVVRKAFHEQKGDILTFLPGAGEILKTRELLENENINAAIHPLFGDLSFQKQQEAILPDPSGRRKIVLATSIAETSLTIEGISVVVDSGVSRVPRFNPRSGFTRLETIRVTRDSADQRAGRAGRLGPGVCYRLWHEREHANLQPNRKPEILEADLASLMLELFQWGIKDVSELNWVTTPPAGAVAQAKTLLEQLGAIENNRITSRGSKMSQLPTHPRMAHLLTHLTDDRKLSALDADVAAILEERDPLPKDSGVDLGLRVEALRKWRSGVRVTADVKILERIERLSSAWRKLLRINVDNDSVADTEIGQLVMEAYPERIAKQVEKNKERYKLFNGRSASLPRNDALTSEAWLAIADLDAGTGGDGKIFLAAALSESDLVDHAEEFQHIYWDQQREMVVGAIEKRVGSTVLSSKTVARIPEEKRIEVLCDVIREQGLKMIGWDEADRQWQYRVQSLRRWRKNEEWPDVSDDTLLARIHQWLVPFLTNISRTSELQKLDLSEIRQTILPWEKTQQLEKLAPSAIVVPSGSSIRLQYSADGAAPVMEVRLQEVFGLSETPTVNGGTQKIMMHLLSPGYKPVQVTQDLRSFWNNAYHEVRKELRVRYPKHSWPEDPWTAQAVRGVKRK